MYKEFIEGFIRGHRWATLQAPCPENKIEEAERYVGFAFPDELKNLLRETDGDNWLLMSADQIMQRVKLNREILADAFDDEDEFNEKVDRHIFFGSNGCGDHYCYRILPNGEADTSAIYIWEHELFETRKVAKDIPDLIAKYYNDEV